MSLLRKSYRRNDEEAIETSDDYLAGPPLKKPKSCAPEQIEATSQPKQAPVWDPFVPLEIIYPTTASSSKRQTPAQESKVAIHATTSTKSMTLTPSTPEPTSAAWSASDTSRFGGLFSHPADVEAALSSTAKKGQKPSKVPRHLVWNSAPSGGAASPVSRLQWSRHSGSLLATSSLDGYVRLWDVLRTSGRQVQAFKDCGGVRDVQFSSDGRSLIFGGVGRMLHMRDIETGKSLLNVAQEADVMNVSDSPEGLVAFSLSSGSILTLDPRDPHICSDSTVYSPHKTEKDAGGRFVRRICDLPGPITSFEFLAGSTIAVTCDPNNRSVSEFALSVWDWESGRAIATGLWNSPLSAFYAIKHPTLSQFAVLTASNTVQAFSGHGDFRAKKKKSFQFEAGKLLSPHRSQISISPDGSLLYVGSGSGSVYAFKYENMGQAGVLNPFGSNPISSLSHHPVLHSYLAVASWNGNVSVYS